MVAEFHFLRPFWFLALIPLLALIWYMLKRGLDNQQWRQVCDPQLLPYILVGENYKNGYKRELLIGLTGLAIIISLAGPTWERLPQPVYKNESALVIALDLSFSMYADDVPPSRVERARFEISDLLDMRKEGQTALLVYAGDAFTVTPMTDDIKTIKSQLGALSPDIMPAPGSDTAQAFSLAVDLLQQGGHRDGDILLVTDEIDERYSSALNEVHDQGYRISILGIGTKEGAPIRLEDGSYLKAPDGSIVIPTLDTDALKKMASAAGGIYQTSRIDDTEIRRFHELFVSQLKSNDEAMSDLRSNNWYEVGPWLLLPLLPLLALGFRRGVLCSLTLVLVSHQEPAVAFDWEQLWLNSDQRAYKAIEQNDAEKAASLFNDPDWKGVANYRAGDYEAAEELFDNDDLTSRYNKANALAKQGRFEEAITAYNDVLQQDAEHEDARYNKELIEQVLQQQKQSTKQADEQTDAGSDNDEADTKGFEGDYNDQQSGSSGQSEEQGEGQSREGQDMSDQEGKGVEKSKEEDLESDNTQKEDDKQETEKNAEQIADSYDGELDEEELAAEQWLRRIPDDPSGLLRRKFRYQYQQQSRQTTTEKYW